jgi:hypothetical protein
MLSNIAVSIAVLSALAAAAPSNIDARQPGGYYVSVGNKYSGKGCDPSTLIFADPIFGDGNVCQPLDRFGDGGPINSYETLSVSAGCSGKFSPLHSLHVQELFADHNSIHLHRTQLLWYCLLGACRGLRYW